MNRPALSRVDAVTTDPPVTENENQNSDVTDVTGVTGSLRTHARVIDPYAYYPSLRNTRDSRDNGDNAVVKGEKRHGRKSATSDNGDNVVSEDELQRIVFTYLSRHLPLRAIAWATSNDSGGRERVHEGARRKAMGRTAGIPDLFVLHDARLIGIELKRPPKLGSKAKPNVSDAQTDTMARLEAAGARCFVCRSVEEVAAALAAQGIPLERRNDFAKPESTK